MFEKLQILFEIFVVFNISIKLFKIFFNYLNVGFFEQKFHFLGLIIVEKNLKVIKELTYPNIPSVFKYYLGSTKYFCSYIYFYILLTKLF